MRRQVTVFFVFAILVVSLLWAYFYMTFSTNGLPLGWDSPYYVWKIESAAQLGAQRFATQEGYYHFLYPVIGSWISALGLGAFLVEIVFPLILWIAGFLLVLLIVKSHTDSPQAPLLGLAAGSTWFAFFRLSSDLHANLLALDLMLAGTWLFLEQHKEHGPGWNNGRFLGLGSIVLVSSFSHVETVLFFAAAWIVALLYEVYTKLLGTKRALTLVVSIALPLLPGVAAYLNQLQLTTSAVEGRFPALPTMQPTFWLLYLGPLGLVALIALVLSVKWYCLKKPYSPLVILSLCWLFVSLVLGLVQYASSHATPFSERAIMLTPTPFLSAEILQKPKWPGLMTQIKGLGLISLVILGGTSAYFLAIGPLYHNSFISYSASEAMGRLRSGGLVDPRESVFIFHEGSIGSGGIAEHDDYWVAAFVGNHYSYFGRLDFFMVGSETPFADERSELISRRMFNNLPPTALSTYTIIYVDEFNPPKPIPVYSARYFEPLVEGVHTVDRAVWQTQARVVVPAYSSLFSADDGWGSVSRDWSESGKVLEFNSTSPRIASTATIAFASPEFGNYTISVRLWDTVGSSNPVSISLDGGEVARIYYNGTQIPTNSTAFSGHLTRGVHYLSFEIQAQPEFTQFVSLDYITIEHQMD